MDEYENEVVYGCCERCGAKVRKIMTTSSKVAIVDTNPVTFYPSSAGNMKFITDDGKIHYGIYEPSGCRIGYVPHKCTNR